MKNTTPIQATTPFPMDVIRSYMGIPESELPIESEDQHFNAPMYSVPKKVVNLSPGNARSRYRRALLAFDGSMPFQSWLRSDYATIENVRAIYTVLNDGGITSRLYLSKVGATSTDEVHGEMLARINLILFEEKMNEAMETDVQGKSTENRPPLNGFLANPGPRGANNFHIPDLLDIIQSAEEKGWKDNPHFYRGSNVNLYRYKLWSYLVNKFYNQFNHMLNHQSNHVDFLASYVMTMLECLQMIKPTDPYWQTNNLKQRIIEIIRFYQHIRYESAEFVRDHLPGSISILRKKRKVNYVLLHTIWIKQKIYHCSYHGRSFRKLMTWLHAYKLKWAMVVNIEVNISYELYKELSYSTRSVSKGILEGFIEVRNI